MSSEVLLFLEIDFLCAGFMIIMLANMWRSRRGGAEDTAFYRGIFTLLIILLTDVLARVLEGHPGFAIHWLLYIVNAIYFMATGIVTLEFMVYIDYKLSDNRKEVDGRTLMYYVPAYILCAMSLLSFRTGSIFFIDAENMYHRGPIHVVQEIIVSLYLFVALGYVIIHYVTSKNIIKRQICLKMLEFVTIPIVGMYFQIRLPGSAVIWPSATIALFVVFSDLQNSRITMDPLTGLNNRTRLIRYISDRTEKVHENQILSCIVIDIDNFKNLNERYGHFIGDDVIVETADIVKHSLAGVPGSHFIARYSGNSFVIVSQGEEEVVESIIQNLENKLESVNDSKRNRFQISLTYGYSLFDKANMSMDAFLKSADDDMYKKKASAAAERASHKKSVSENMFEDR